MPGLEPRNFVRTCLLLLLAEGPDHGYQLAERLRPFLDGDTDPTSVYRALHTLRSQGLIRDEQASSELGPTRRVYRLTAEGRMELDRHAAELAQLRRDLGTYLHRFRQLQGRGGGAGPQPRCSRLAGAR